jgi:hypothetical protein
VTAGAFAGVGSGAVQWVLQRFEDTERLGDVLAARGIAHSWHDVVPFVGQLVPEPVIDDPGAVILFGSYTLWRHAEARGWRPGVIRVAPFVHEEAWKPFLMNGRAVFVRVGEIAEWLPEDDRQWFIRPVGDDKEVAGNVRSAARIREMARKVMALDAEETPEGSLRHDTLMMLAPPARILREWRIWVVKDEIVTYSLYREGGRVIYRSEIDPDALGFARDLIARNEGYACAYVMDICRVAEGLRLLETNCINAAGFYAADIARLAVRLDGLAGG